MGYSAGTGCVFPAWERLVRGPAHSVQFVTVIPIPLERRRQRDCLPYLPGLHGHLSLQILLHSTIIVQGLELSVCGLVFKPWKIPFTIDR